MRKYLCVLLVCFCMMGILSGCSKALDVDRDTITVGKKGNISGVSVDKLDKDYYSKDELQEYIKERVDSYTADNEKSSVKEGKFSLDDEVAKLQLKYAGYKDYAAFNEVSFFEGLVSEALAAGYDFETEFSAVIDGKKEDGAAKEDIMEDSDYKVVILDEVIDVKVAGEILYVSTENTELKGKDTVSVKQADESEEAEAELPLAYIVYK